MPSQNEPIFAFADPAHLLKNFRNAWEKFDFSLSSHIVEKYNLPSNKVDYNVLRDLVTFQDKHMGPDMKIAPRLTSDHLDLKNKSSIAKMAVPPAEAVISRDTASAIRYLIKHHKYDPAAETP